MLCSYKFWFIRRDDNDFITEISVRFYEGRIKAVQVRNPDTRILEEKMQYVREKRLASNDLSHIRARGIIQESNGADCALFTQADFGVTKSLDDIRLFLNTKLAKDPMREVIAEQKIA